MEGFLRGLGVLAQGANAFIDESRAIQDRRRQVEERALRIAQAHQQLEHARNMEARQAQGHSRNLAEQDFGLIQKQALATKDPAQLAALANQGTEVLRKGGFNVPNQKIVGGMALLPHLPNAPVPQGATLTGKEMPRPSATMQGPMPEGMKQQTFDTPQTKAAARGMLLLPAQQTEYKVVDHGTGGAGYWTLNPDAAPSFTQTRNPAVKTPSVRYEDDVVQEDGTIIRKRPAKARGGSGPKPLRRLVQQSDGSWVEVSGGAQTEVPTKPPKPVSDSELREQAKFEAGTPPTADDELLNPGAKAAHNARVQQIYRRLKNQQKQSAVAPANNGVDPALAAHVMKALAGRKGNKQ